MVICKRGIAKILSNLSFEARLEKISSNCSHVSNNQSINSDFTVDLFVCDSSSFKSQDYSSNIIFFDSSESSCKENISLSEHSNTDSTIYEPSNKENVSLFENVILSKPSNKMIFSLSGHSNTEIISSSEPDNTDTSLFEPSCNEPVSLSEHSSTKMFHCLNLVML